MIKRWAAPFVWLAVSAGLVFVLGTQVFSLSERIPNATAFGNQTGDTNISVREYLAFLSRAEEERERLDPWGSLQGLTPLVRKEGEVRADYRSGRRANLIYTGASMAALTGARCSPGAFFSDNPGYDNHIAVISYGLAGELFIGTDVVGMRVFINDVPYTVCGVLSPGASLAHDLAGNGGEDVYIPIDNLNGEDKINQILLPQNAPRGGVDVRDILQRQFPAARVTQTERYGDTLRMVRQSLPLSVCFVVLSFAVLLAYTTARLAAKAFRQVCACRNEGRPVRKTPIVLAGALLLACWAVPALAFARGAFSVFIPPQWLPSAHFFDVRHYYELYIATVQRMNITDYSYFQALSLHSLQSCYLLCFCVLLTGILFCAAGMRGTAATLSRIRFDKDARK